MIPVPTASPLLDTLSMVTTLGAITSAALATAESPMSVDFTGAAVTNGELLASCAESVTAAPSNPPARPLPNAITAISATAPIRAPSGRLLLGTCGGVLIQCESLMSLVSRHRATFVIQKKKESSKNLSLETAKGAVFRPPLSEVFSTRDLALKLDLNVNASWQFNSLERIDCLVVWLDNVNETLVDAHLEVLA